MTDGNREVLRRLQEAAQAQDWEAVSGCFTEGFVNHASPFQGADGMTATLQAIGADLDITHHAVHDSVAEGDRVVQRVSLSGTHQGSRMPVLQGIPVHGKPFAWDFIHIWRFEGDRIAEHWACRDDLGLRHQLEVV